MDTEAPVIGGCPREIPVRAVSLAAALKRSRSLSVPVTAACLAAGAFAFRILTLRSLSNDHYIYLAWAQQVLAGEVPGRDFVDPGMPLAYGLSAAVQRLQPGPFSEAVLTSLMLGLAAAFTCLVVTRMTGSLLAGIAATLFEIALQPRLYSYPKILVPAVALWLLQRYAAQPSRTRLAATVLWTVAAGLLRYDLALYAAGGTLAVLLVTHWREPRQLGVALGSSVLIGCLLVSPYVAFVEWRQGIGNHLHDMAEYLKYETHQLRYPWPNFPALQSHGVATWGQEDSAAFLFYAAYGLAVVSWGLCLGTRRYQERRSVAAAAATMLTAYLLIVLRHPIQTRTPDLAAVIALAGGWTIAETSRLVARLLSRASLVSVVTAILIGVPAAGVALGSGVSVWVLGSVGSQVRATRLSDGPSKMLERAASVRDAGTRWPWRFWPAGSMPAAVPYLKACTGPNDQIMLTWLAPEYFYFSGRMFAAGHAFMIPGPAFASPHDQNLMLRRLSRGRVPIALINETQRESFAAAYPQVNAYLREYYRPAGEFSIRGGSRIIIGLRKDVSPIRDYADTGWPCLTSER